MKNNQNKIHIKTDRNFYFSGDKISGKIFVDITELTNSKGVQLTIKGKETLQSNLESTNSDSSDEDEDEKNNKITTNSSNSNMFKTTKSTSSYKPPKLANINNNDINNNNNNDLNYNDDIEIFKSKTYIPISLSNYIKEGKYILPFEATLPKNIPGTFLLNTSHIFCEIFYTLKAKLIDSNNEVLKCAIPLIVREKESRFDYKNNISKTSDIGNCCCGKGRTKIDVAFPLGFVSIGKSFQIKVNVDNTKCDVDANNFFISVFQKIILHPNKKDQKEIYNEISFYENENKIKANEQFNDFITFNNDSKFNSIKNLDNKSYMFKLFPEKNKLLNLYSSVKSEIIQCEYEFSITAVFTSWNVDEINITIPVILYPNDNIFKNIDSSILTDFNNAVTKDKTVINVEKNQIQFTKILNKITESQEESENSSDSFEEDDNDNSSSDSNSSYSNSYSSDDDSSDNNRRKINRNKIIQSVNDTQSEQIDFSRNINETENDLEKKKSVFVDINNSNNNNIKIEEDDKKENSFNNSISNSFNKNNINNNDYNNNDNNKNDNNDNNNDFNNNDYNNNNTNDNNENDNDNDNNNNNTNDNNDNDNDNNNNNNNNKIIKTISNDYNSINNENEDDNEYLNNNNNNNNSNNNNNNYIINNYNISTNSNNSIINNSLNEYNFSINDIQDDNNNNKNINNKSIKNSKNKAFRKEYNKNWLNDDLDEEVISD